MNSTNRSRKPGRSSMAGKTFALMAVFALMLSGMASNLRGADRSSHQSSRQQMPAAAEKQAAAPQLAATRVSASAEMALEPAAQEGLQPVPIELPKPMFEGTPENLKVPNLEKPRGKPRPPFLAPVGVTNVARGKSVTSTDKEPTIGELDMLTDGDKAGGDGSYVELGPNLQSVTIDLKGEYAIYGVLFWHYHKQARVYLDVIVQVSDDRDFVKNVVTIFNNDHDNTSGLGAGQDKNYIETAEGKLVDAKGVHGRYVRLYSNGNNSNELNHYVEVEVYGKPVK